MTQPKRIETELGIEKLCAHCGNYWPLDEEFWFFQWRAKRDGSGQWKHWESACKGCYREVRKKGRFAIKKEVLPSYRPIVPRLSLAINWGMGVSL